MEKNKSKTWLIVLLSILGVAVICIGGVIIAGISIYNANDRNSISLSSYDYDGGVGSISSYKSVGTADYAYEESAIAPEYYQTEGATDTLNQVVLKSGSLSIVIDNFDASQKSITEAAKKYEGYVISISDYGTDNDKVVSMTVRVPAESFDAAIEEFKAIGSEVVDLSINTDDVTMEYVDLQARLENLKTSEKQFTEIMSRAVNIEDILAVQRELTNVRSQIESLQGQINYYDNHSELSTISISMSLNPDNIVIPEEQWRPLGVLKNAFQAFVEFLKGVFVMIVWIVIFSPVIIIPYIIIRLIIKAKKKAKLAEKGTEELKK